MAETSTLLLLLLTLLLFFPTTTTAQVSSPETLLAAAAQTLTDSGFLSMALTLRLASPALHLPSPAATIFVPSDAAFLRSGPLPLSLLQYHVLPSRLPLQHLITLPRGTPIPTLLPNSSLTVTTSYLPPLQLSLNDVVVASAPIFDDGSLLMFPIADFFNSSSLIVPEIVRYNHNNQPFAAVSDVLKSNGFSITATFLEAQLATEFEYGAKFTVFAPSDEAILQSVRNIADYSTIFRKHIVPRLIPWRDLIGLPDQTLLPTFSEGFLIRVTVAPRVRFLNGVTIAFPDVYRGGDVIVVHGIDGLLDNTTV